MAVKLTDITGKHDTVPTCLKCKKQTALIPYKHPSTMINNFTWVYHCPVCHHAYSFLDPLQNPIQ